MKMNAILESSEGYFCSKIRPSTLIFVSRLGWLASLDTADSYPQKLQNPGTKLLRWRQSEIRAWNSDSPHLPAGELIWARGVTTGVRPA